MKHFQRVLTWFLLCGLLLIFVGCGSDPEETDGKDSSGDTVWDMEGYDFQLMTESDSDNHVMGYSNTQVLYDVMMERFQDIEQRYNCTITPTYTPKSDDGAALVSRVVAGQYLSEVLRAGYNNHPAKFCRAGMLIPLPDLADYLDYENEKKFGSVAQLECCMADSIPYAVVPAALPYNFGGGSFLIAYNRDYLDEYNLTSPHEYYENKNWTFDALEGLLDTWYLGPDAHPQYVLSGAPRAFSQLVLFSNGIRFTTEQDGELITDIYSPASVHAIEWLQKIATNYGKTSLYMPSDYWDTATFKSGNTFMALASGGQVVGELVYSDYKVGIMPFPNGPDAVYGQFTTFLESGADYMFMASADWPEAAATVTSDIFEPLPGYGDESADMTSFYRANVFFDDIDTEIYMHHLDYARYTYWNFGGIELSTNIATSLLSSSATELLQHYGPTFEKCFEEEIKGNFEYLNTHMYNR